MLFQVSHCGKMELGKEQKDRAVGEGLQSRTLQNSENLKAFLRFVVEKTLANEDVQLKEYTIATEVFGRRSDYDPRIDSVVRVQAGRLRTKLQEYYTVEGKNDQIVIDLPKGHYHPVFNCPHAESGQEISSAGSRTSRWALFEWAPRIIDGRGVNLPSNAFRHAPAPGRSYSCWVGSSYY